MNHHVLIKFRQNWSKQEVTYNVQRSTNVFILFGIRKQWKESTIVPVYETVDKTDCTNYSRISLLPATYKMPSCILLTKLTPYVDVIIGNHQWNFDVIDQLLKYSAFVIQWRKMGV